MFSLSPIDRNAEPFSRAPSSVPIMVQVGTFPEPRRALGTVKTGIPNIDLRAIELQQKKQDAEDDEELLRLRTPEEVVAALDTTAEDIPTTTIEARDLDNLPAILAKILSERSRGVPTPPVPSLPPAQDSSGSLELILTWSAVATGEALERWAVRANRVDDRVPGSPGSPSSEDELAIIERQIVRSCCFLPPLDEPCALTLHWHSAAAAPGAIGEPDAKPSATLEAALSSYEHLHAESRVPGVPSVPTPTRAATSTSDPHDPCAVHGQTPVSGYARSALLAGAAAVATALLLLAGSAAWDVHAAA